MVSPSTQEAWRHWWNETKGGSINTYASIVLFFLSTVLAKSIARCLFWIVRKACPTKWMYVSSDRAALTSIMLLSLHS